MKCPHCRVEIHRLFNTTTVASHGETFRALNQFGVPVYWEVNFMQCPACDKGILELEEQRQGSGLVQLEHFIVPKSSSRPKASIEVPQNLAEDFNEACMVLSDSPKASAALSRRCLQGVLRDHNFNQHDLARAIDAVLATKSLPSFLASSVDAIRVVGNFAAHPSKDTQSGEILPVEPDEASWNLDVLEGLFDFYYVAPAREKSKIDSMNAKLLAAGKPPMK